jgi:hypothetical protein
MTSYESRPIKRARRTSAEIDRIKDAIYDTLAADNPMTIRGLFYQLVSKGVVEKTEAQYKTTVTRLAGEMRLARELPFNWVADHTRWRHGGSAFTSLENWLEESTATYRLDLWRDQDAYVEVWLEKDALTGVLISETDPLRVPLMVTRGYPSLTYLASAAANLRAIGRPTFLYYFGDHDPSGVDIPRVVEKRLREFAPECEICFERVAVLPEQIEELGLQTRPTKTTDSRSRGFTGGESVEVDAVPASILRQWCREKIEQHLDPEKLDGGEVGAGGARIYPAPRPRGGAMTPTPPKDRKGRFTKRVPVNKRLSYRRLAAALKPAHEQGRLFPDRGPA